MGFRSYIWFIKNCRVYYINIIRDTIKHGKELSENPKSFIEIENQALGLKKQLNYYEKRYHDDQKKRFGNKLAEKIEKHHKALKEQNIDPEYEDMPPLEDYDQDYEYLGPDNKNKDKNVNT